MLGWSYVKPIMLEVNKLQIIKSELIAKINEEKGFVREEEKIKVQNLDIKKKMARYIRFDDKSVVKTELLTAILQAGECQGFVIKSIDSVNWRAVSNTEVLTMHVIANGTFAQFYAYIDKIFRYSLPFVLSDFSIAVLASGLLEIDMHLDAFFVKTFDAQWVSLPQWKIRSLRRELGDGLDPFYKAKREIELINFNSSELASRLDRVSYDQIRFVGYMVDDERRWVLARLPDGGTVEIFQNTVFGVEKVKVESISEEGVLLEVSGEKKLVRYAINSLQVSH